MELRRRKYSEVSNDFIIATVVNKFGNLKDFLKDISIWGAIALVFMIGFDYWKNGFISLERVESSIGFLVAIVLFLLIIITIGVFIPRHAYIGIHPEGIWIYDDQVGDIGFIEWGWIKEIKISPKYEIVYIVVYDMDSLKKCVIKRKIGFDTFLVATNGSEKAKKIPIGRFSQEIVNCIVANQFANLEIIE